MSSTTVSVAMPPVLAKSGSSSPPKYSSTSALAWLVASSPHSFLRHLASMESPSAYSSASVPPSALLSTRFFPMKNLLWLHDSRTLFSLLFRMFSTFGGLSEQA